MRVVRGGIGRKMIPLQRLVHCPLVAFCRLCSSRTLAVVVGGVHVERAVTVITMAQRSRTGAGTYVAKDGVM